MKPGKIAEKNKEVHTKKIFETIKKYKIFNIVDIFAFYKGCSRATFYNLELDKLDIIKEAIDDNKIVTKQSLKAKWAKSDNPTLQVALFKTICTDEERRTLSMSYQEIKHEITSEDLSKLTLDQLRERAKLTQHIEQSEKDKK